MDMGNHARLSSYPVTPHFRTKPRPRLPYCLQAGENLFRNGDASTGLFEIADGTVRLSRITRGGRRCVIGFGFPGDILGFSPNGDYTLDCDALSAAQVIRHRPEALHSNDADPHLQQLLLDGAMAQIEAMQDHCMMVGRNAALDRVAAFLSLLGDRLGVPSATHITFDMPMPRADIADYLGLTTETVSRCLTELRHAKLITIENLYHFILLKPQALDALAEGAH